VRDESSASPESRPQPNPAGPIPGDVATGEAVQSEPTAAEPTATEPTATERTPSEPLQFLNPEGELTTAGPFASYLTHLDARALRELYRDMALTRRFDAEATALQRQGELGLWAPCLGQEGAQVGSARALQPQDFAFPAYRDHGVLAARGVELTRILMHTRGVDHGGWDPREHNCHLYTLVVGAQTLHATGYAIGVRKDGACGTGDATRDAAVIVYFGDGATSEGDVAEALTFAAVNQAPLVFFCQNNQWAISEPVARQSVVPLARRAEGFGVPGVRVDGNDVLACYAATAAALDRARAGQGPQFIEALTYRLGPHTTADDPTRYRDAAETEQWRAKDPIVRLRRLIERYDPDAAEFFDEVEREADELGERTRTTARALDAPPLEHFFDLAYAEPHPLVDEERAVWEALSGRELGGHAPAGESSSRQAAAVRTEPTPAHALTEHYSPAQSSPAPAMSANIPTPAPQPALTGRPQPIQAHDRPTTRVERLSLAKAINAGLRDALAEDPRTLVMGEDVGRLGGVFRVTDGLFDAFGAERVVDTPLAEAGIVGTAIGLALRGYRPVCEIQFDAFVYPAFDQITSQLAKLHSRSGGRLTLPVVIRIPYGGGIGAVEHHSESPETLFAHTAGLRVVSPATPQDGYTMIRQAIATADPVIFLEPKARYWDAADVTLGTPDEWPPLNAAREVLPGTDVTLVAYGPSVHVATQAAQDAADDGWSVGVLDLRSVSPIDFDAIEAAVRQTGRLVVVHEAPVFFGAGAEIAARITERCFHHLEAPVLRVGGFHLPYPPARVERDYLPSVGRVRDAIDRALSY